MRRTTRPFRSPTRVARVKAKAAESPVPLGVVTLLLIVISTLILTKDSVLIS